MDDFDDVNMRMLELSFKGYLCSQVLIILGLEAQGKTNPDLVRAMRGLTHGGCSEEGTCGALTGAACLLSLYAGKGTDDEDQGEGLPLMLGDLGEWFADRYGTRYGGVSCDTIQGDRAEVPQRCRTIVAEIYAKVAELLVSRGYDISVGR
ncbi:MAG: C_GCAxxG_C_C family protein [Coriobacteriia bacterium]|nr:C_GCAxxG_C_C family protein [Coriobacteriia bacterium]